MNMTKKNNLEYMTILKRQAFYDKLHQPYVKVTLPND